MEASKASMKVQFSFISWRRHCRRESDNLRGVYFEVNEERLARSKTITHGGSFQYDSRALSCVISIRFTPIEGIYIFYTYLLHGVLASSSNFQPF